MRRIFSFTVPVLTLFLHSAMAAAQVAASADTTTVEVRKVVDEYMQPFLAQQNAPGAIVGISIHGKRSYFAYGRATDDGASFEPTTLVEIGSCTKVFTTTLFALAVGRHQMAPDQSIQKYMPSGFTLQPVAQQITPMQLADFSSGMPRDPTNLMPELRQRSIDIYTTKDFLRWVSKWKPDAPPPAAYLYSNAGIGLLGYLVANATGKSWEEQLNHEIVSPLGMTDTEMRPSPEQVKRLATGHTENGTVAPVWPIYAWFAAGSLRSTALDMLRFGEANWAISKLMASRCQTNSLPR